IGNNGSGLASAAALVCATPTATAGYARRRRDHAAARDAAGSAERAGGGDDTPGPVKCFVVEFAGSADRNRQRRQPRADGRSPGGADRREWYAAVGGASGRASGPDQRVGGRPPAWRAAARRPG